MGSKLTEKDPQSTRRFEMPWAVDLNGETIASSEWTGGLTVDSSDISGSKTTVTLSGGNDGVDYEMVNQIVTSSGETLEKTLTVMVRDL